MKLPRALASTTMLALVVMFAVPAGAAWQGQAQGQTQGKPTEAKPGPADAPAKPATAASLAGKWTVSVDTQQGPMQSALELKVDPKDAKKVIGTMVSQMGETTITGEVVNGTLTFQITMAGGNGEMAIAFTATEQKDGSLSGTFDYGQGTLPWTAVRVKN